MTSEPFDFAGYRAAFAAKDVELSDEVIGTERIAFACTVTLGNGNRIIEHVIAHLRDGLIARHVDVEAWD